MQGNVAMQCGFENAIVTYLDVVREEAVEEVDVCSSEMSQILELANWRWL